MEQRLTIERMGGGLDIGLRPDMDSTAAHHSLLNATVKASDWHNPDSATRVELLVDQRLSSKETVRTVHNCTVSSDKPIPSVEPLRGVAHFSKVKRGRSGRVVWERRIVERLSGFKTTGWPGSEKSATVSQGISPSVRSESRYTITNAIYLQWTNREAVAVKAQVNLLELISNRARRLDWKDEYCISKAYGLGIANHVELQININQIHNKDEWTYRVSGQIKVLNTVQNCAVKSKTRTPCWLSQLRVIRKAQMLYASGRIEFLGWCGNGLQGSTEGGPRVEKPCKIQNVGMNWGQDPDVYTTGHCGPNRPLSDQNQYSIERLDLTAIEVSDQYPKSSATVMKGVAYRE